MSDEASPSRAQVTLRQSLTNLSSRHADLVRAFKAATADVLVFDRTNVSVVIGPTVGSLRYWNGKLQVQAQGNINTAPGEIRFAIDQLTQLLISDGLEQPRTGAVDPVDWRLIKTEADNANLVHVLILEFMSLFRVMLHVFDIVGDNKPWAQGLVAARAEVVEYIDIVLARPPVDFTDSRFGFQLEDSTGLFRPPPEAIDFRLADFTTADFSYLPAEIVVTEIIHTLSHYLTGAEDTPPHTKPWAERLMNYNIYSITQRAANPLSFAISKMETVVVLVALGFRTGQNNTALADTLTDMTRYVVVNYQTRQPEQLVEFLLPSLVLVTARWTISRPRANVFAGLDRVLYAFREIMVTILDTYWPGNDAQGLIAAAAVVSATHEWFFSRNPDKQNELPVPGTPDSSIQSVYAFQPDELHLNPQNADGLALSLQRVLRLVDPPPAPQSINIQSPYRAVTNILNNYAFFTSRPPRSPGLLPRMAYFYARVMLDFSRDRINFVGFNDLNEWLKRHVMRLANGATLQPELGVAGRLQFVGLAAPIGENQTDLYQMFARGAKMIPVTQAPSQQRNNVLLDQATASNIIRVYEEEIQEETSESRALARRLRKGKEEVEETESEAQSLVLRQRRTQNAADDSQARIAELTETIVSLTEALENTQDELARNPALLAELRNLRQERDDLREANQRLLDRQAAIAAQGSELAEAQNNLEASREREQTLMDRIRSLVGLQKNQENDVANASEPELIEQQRQLEEAQALVEQAESDLDAQRRVSADLKARVTSLQGNLDAARAEVAQLTSDVQQAEKAVVDSQAEISRLEGDLAAEVDRAQKLDDELNQVRTELALQQQQFQETEDTLVDLTEAITVKTEELNQQSSILADLQQQLDDALNEIARLQSDKNQLEEQLAQGESSLLTRFFGSINIRMEETVRFNDDPNVELYFTHLESLGTLVYSFNRIVVPGWKPSGLAAAVKAFDDALELYVATGNNKPLAAATAALRDFPLTAETAPRLAIVTSFCDSPSPLIL